MVAEADLVLSVTEVAVTVTVLPVGIAAGAVKVVVAVLPEALAGLKLPHEELPQVTVQFTPAALLSSLTLAVKTAEVPTTIDVGGFEIVTEIMGGGVMVTETEADFAEFAAEVAVMVTLFPVGTEDGAVYDVVELLPVELAGLTLPQDELPQVTVQVTPAPVPSFETTAVKVAVVPTTTEAGGFEIVTVINVV